jgi:hypothetical protein
VGVRFARHPAVSEREWKNRLFVREQNQGHEFSDARCQNVGGFRVSASVRRHEASGSVRKRKEA